jgi:hypothetical protein
LQFPAFSFVPGDQTVYTLPIQPPSLRERDACQVNGSELLAQPLGICPAAAAAADMEMAGEWCVFAILV